MYAIAVTVFAMCHINCIYTEQHRRLPNFSVFFLFSVPIALPEEQIISRYRGNERAKCTHTRSLCQSVSVYNALENFDVRIMVMMVAAVVVVVRKWKQFEMTKCNC